MTTAIKAFHPGAAFRLVLPKEHGSWSLALEPVALGLLVAPSNAGAALAVSATAGFFMRRPLKIIFRERDLERWKLACACVSALVFIVVAALWFSIKLGGAEKLWPLLPAAIAGLVFAWADSRNEAREGAAEIAGAVAFSMLPVAFASLAGWSVPSSLALGAMSLTRSVPTVLTVRTCLRRAKKLSFSATPALLTALAGILVMSWLTATNLAPTIGAALALVLAGRTFWLLLGRTRLSARQIGISEAVLGGVIVLLLACFWR